MTLRQIYHIAHLRLHPSEKRRISAPGHFYTPIIKVLVSCLGLLLFSAAGAQPYSFLAKSVADGLPQSQVWSAFADSRGYLWFGTQGGGLSRYDGKDFQTFTTEDGLPSNYIHSVYQDRNYRLLIGTNRGLCSFDGYRIQAIPGTQAQINAMIGLPDGAVWLGTNAGIYVFRPDRQAVEKLRLLPGIDQTPVFAFLRNEAGIWIATEQGVWLRGASTRRLSSQTCYALATDDRNRIWVANWGQGLSILDGTNGTSVAELRNPLLERVLCIFGPLQGKMWLGTQNSGLAPVDLATNAYAQIGEVQGLPHNHVRAITADRSGQLWIATSGGGVARMLRQNFRHFNRENGLAGSRIYAVCEDAGGKIWVAVSQNGIQALDSTGFQAPRLDSLFRNTKCRSICCDKSGALWVGTEGKGLAILDTAGVQLLDSRNGLLSDWIQQVVADPQGAVWAASSGGISRILRGPDGAVNIRHYGEKEGLPDLYVSTLVVDIKGAIWFGTQTGKVGVIKNGKVEAVYGAAEGLPSVPVRALMFDKMGRLWVGTKGNGLWVAALQGAKTRFAQPATPRRLSSQNIYLVLCDSGGRIWAGSETGVDKLLLDGSGAVVDLRHYGKNEGFLGIETCQNAAINDRNGRAWFGTMNGLTQYTPGDESGEEHPPLVHFEEIALFYKPLRETNYAAWGLENGGLKPGLQLPYGQNHLSFHFRAVDTEHPEKVRYRWRLDGADADWSPASEQLSVNYANLPPGAYTFWVQASSDEMSWSEPVQASFTILKPFWQEAWFRVSALLLGLSVIALGARWYIQRIKAREAARREHLEVQNKLLLLEQKALQLQMNPHFIFNALTSIQSLITEKDFAEARKELNRFAKLMRSILYNSRKQTISLKEEVDTLEQYLNIEQFCHQHKFDFSIQLPEDIDAEELELPPMLLQPFVENAVVHGVSHLGYPGKIEILFRQEQDLLLCVITDNGVGREKAARLREEKKPGHQSVAMQVTQERLEALRGNENYPSLEISDVTDPEGRIQGTQVRVRVPLIVKY